MTALWEPGGARDSSFILYIIKKKFKLNVLALNYDNGFSTSTGIG